MRILSVEAVKYDANLRIVNIQLDRAQGGFFRTWADERRYLYIDISDDAGQGRARAWTVFSVRCPESVVSEMVLRWG